MTTWDAIAGDILDVKPEQKYHALFCDPPYELGFMGKDWDRSGIAFQKETWEHLAKFLYPGAFGMAFSSSRGWHRLACAIEDAGLVLHPSIFMAWCYGSGFPKATDVSKMIDKAAGAEREVVGEGKGRTGPAAQPHGGSVHSDDAYQWPGDYDITAPATPLAKVWNGHKYGLQALKPAIEPIIVFQKPYEGKAIDSITTYGAGALNIDGARLGTHGERPTGSGNLVAWRRMEGLTHINKHDINATPPSGRWPANFVLVHAPGCKRVGTRQIQAYWGQPTERTTSPSISTVNIGKSEKKDKVIGYADPDGKETIDAWECVEGCPVKKLGEQSGERASGDIREHHQRHTLGGNERTHGKMAGALGPIRDGDTGTAARFFFQAGWNYETEEILPDADPVGYVPKAAKSERNEGLEAFYWQKDPSTPYGFRRIDYMDWQRLDKKARARGNIHTTVKPIALGRWLTTLLLPPAHYAPRRILVPFAGTFSDAISAMLSGWDEITAIELYQENIDIGEARMNHWHRRLLKGDLPETSLPDIPGRESQNGVDNAVRTLYDFTAQEATQ